jgi:hypothetical protein
MCEAWRYQPVHSRSHRRPVALTCNPTSPTASAPAYRASHRDAGGTARISQPSDTTSPADNAAPCSICGRSNTAFPEFFGTPLDWREQRLAVGNFLERVSLDRKSTERHRLIEPQDVRAWRSRRGGSGLARRRRLRFGRGSSGSRRALAFRAISSCAPVATGRSGR